MRKRERESLKAAVRGGEVWASPDEKCFSSSFLVRAYMSERGEREERGEGV